MNSLLSKKHWLAGLLLLLLVACGPATNSPGAEDSLTDGDTAVETTDTGNNPTTPVDIDPSAGITTASGLQYIETVAGTGAAPQVGDQVSVHYTGRLEDGTEFDSSIGRGQPFQFTLGQGAVIAGWDEGIALMKEGGQAQLVIPSELGYGPNGSGVIPPNATLIFDVELVQVTPTPKPTEVEEGDYTTTDSGLKYHIFEQGDGDTAVVGDLVTIDFTFWLEDGSLVGSTKTMGSPFTFVVGSEASLPGLDEGILLLNNGGSAQLLLTPELGDGSGASYVFEVELLEVNDPPVPAELEDGDYTVTESGLKYAIVQESDGALPVAGDMVNIAYTLWLADGTLVDSSAFSSAPLQVVAGSGQVIPGFDEGLLLIPEGGKAQLIIPPALGYGDAGSGPIPPATDIIFEVEIIAINATE